MSLEYRPLILCIPVGSLGSVPDMFHQKIVATTQWLVAYYATFAVFFSLWNTYNVVYIVYVQFVVSTKGALLDTPT